MQPAARARRLRLVLCFSLLTLAALNNVSAQTADDAGPRPDATPAVAASGAEGGVADYEPGEYVDLGPPVAGRGAFDPRAVKVCFRRAGEAHAGEASVCEEGAELLPVRGHVGHRLKPRHEGRYEIWYEPGGEKKVINLRRPALVGRSVRGAKGARVVVEIETPGVPSVEVTLGLRDPQHSAFATLSDGQPPAVVSHNRRARFNVDIKECGKADFVATAQGFGDAVLNVSCSPPGPIPVIFLPGTAGSELDLPLKSERYWLNRETLTPQTLPRGMLREDGTDYPDDRAREVTIRSILEEAFFDLTGEEQIVKTLARLGMELPCVRCEDEPKLDPCAGTSDCDGLRGSCNGGVKCDPCDTWKRCKGLRMPVYGPLVDWMRANFVGAREEDAKEGDAKEEDAPVYNVPYDWRKGVDQAAARAIGEKVETALGKYPDHDRVVLIAHSLGGLVGRDYVAGPGRGKVAALIAAGTLWLGAPKPSRALLWGYDFEVGRSLKLGGRTRVIDPKVTGKNPPDGVERETRADNFIIVSLLDFNKARETARTWPGVFFQLPTRDFMTLYGRASRAPAGRSVVWNWSPRKTLDFHAGKVSEEAWAGDEKVELTGNAILFKRADAWRERALFKGNDYGATHYLIAGYNHALTSPSDAMHMQMIKPTDQLRRSASGKILNLLKKFAIKHAGPTLGLELYETDYLPTDYSRFWGDGTAPLLSASAGARLRGDTPREDFNLAAARQFLGEDTHVYVRELNPAYSHATMFNDPKVRWDVWRAYRHENALLGVSVNPRVRTIVVEVVWKSNDGVEALNFKLAGHALKRSGAAPVKVKDDTVTSYEFEVPEVPSGPDGKRRLRFDDVLGKTLEVEADARGSITIRRVRLLVNEMEVVSHTQDKRLTKSDASYFVIPLPNLDTNPLPNSRPEAGAAHASLYQSFIANFD